MSGIGGGSACAPRIRETGAEHDIIELCDARLAKPRILQLGRAITALEQKPERMLGRASVVAARVSLHAQPQFSAKPLVEFGSINSTLAARSQAIVSLVAWL